MHNGTQCYILGVYRFGTYHTGVKCVFATVSALIMCPCNSVSKFNFYKTFQLCVPNVQLFDRLVAVKTQQVSCRCLLLSSLHFASCFRTFISLPFTVAAMIVRLFLIMRHRYDY